MLPKHEEKAYIQVREERIRKEWANLQEGESLQQAFTPLSLTYEMLQKLPSLEDKNILVIANIETVLFLDTLKRDGYVNFNKLHFLTDIKKLEGKEGVSYISFNELDKVDLGMKFDVVIGNPPYQDSSNKSKRWTLWSKFVEKALTVSKDYVLFVTPSSWLGPGKEHSLIFNKLIYANLDAGEHFNNIGSTFSYFLLSNKADNSKVDIEVNNVVNTLLKDVPFLSNDSRLWKIAEKFFREDTFDFNRTTEHHTSNKEMFSPNGKYKVFHSHAQTLFSDTPPTRYDYKNYKAFLTLSGYPTVLVEKDVALSQIGAWMEIPESKVDGARDVLNSNLYQAILKSHKWSGWNSLHVIKALPALDLTRRWTNEEVYKEFTLTAEEINLVESIVA